jgi:DHA3 family macrolide efflux protein-like MFS transporter
MQTSPPVKKRPAGMTGFTIVFVGQLISVIATQMTGFALTLWIYGKTSSATALGLAQVFFIVPFLIISPIAGAMVDRYNRKLMMMISDIGAGLAVTVLLILQASGTMQLWHLYAMNVAIGLVSAFQWPAYSAAITTMVSKEQYGRANGMMSLIDAGPGVIAPILGAALIGIIKLSGVLLIDAVTYGIAILSLAIVFVPQPAHSAEGEKAKSNIWKESLFGFKYIFARRGLLGLLCIFLVGNLFSGIAGTLFAPEILARTGNNSALMGTVQSTAAIAAVAGGLIMSAWGGFKRRINGVVLGWLLSSLFGMTLFGFGRGLAVWIPTAMFMTVFGALINGSSQAIWQAKVEPDVQGRVFSARRLIAWITQPITPIIAGTLADYVLEPAMKTQTPLSNIFGPIFGIGPGAGMGILISICGVGAVLTAIVGYSLPVIRNVEDSVPDHSQIEKAAKTAIHGEPVRGSPT